MVAFRSPTNFFFGNLNIDAAVSDTTLSSPSFTALPASFSVTQVMPLVLINTSNDVYEVVWISGHVAGSSQVTVLRGKEGTTAQPWPANTQFVCAPTTRDGTFPLTSTTWPADAHVGMRGVETDTGMVREQTANQGLQGYARANTADLGTALDGSTTPNGMSLIVKAWYATGGTDSNGKMTTAIPGGGFPTKLVTATVNRVLVNAFYVPAIDLSSTKTNLVVLCATPSSGPVVNTSGMGMSVIAVGY